MHMSNANENLNVAPTSVKLSPFVRAIVREIQRDGRIVGEERNIVAVFFTLLTKDFRKKLRLHAVLISLSGSGKSTLAEAVLTPFKNSRATDVIEVTRITPASLDRFKETLDGKIVYLNQLTGSEPLTIIPLLSEGSLKLLTAEKTQNGNSIQTVLHEVEGMPCLLSTLTNPNFSSEFLRRTLELTLDESPQQTQRIIEAYAKTLATVTQPSIRRFLFCERVIDRVRDFRPSSIVDEVYVPFAPLLASKIPDTVSARSQWPKFLKMVQAIALVKSICYRGYYRAKMSGEGVKDFPHTFAVATPEDFADAYFVLGSSFFEPIPSAAERILNYLKSEIETDTFGREQFKRRTIRQIMSATHLSKTTVHKYTDLLGELGLIAKEMDAISGRETAMCQYVRSTLETNFELETFNIEEWISGNFPNAKKIEIEDPVFPHSVEA
jgi:hypothetical protein